MQVDIGNFIEIDIGNFYYERFIESYIVESLRGKIIENFIV